MHVIVIIIVSLLKVRLRVSKRTPRDGIHSSFCDFNRNFVLEYFAQKVKLVGCLPEKLLGKRRQVLQCFLLDVINQRVSEGINRALPFFDVTFWNVNLWVFTHHF